VLKVNMPIRALALLGCVLFWVAVASAQSGDWHLSADGAKTFFLRSPFAHGYMHGYEEGFHRGDLDLQMGRAFRQVKEQPDFKKICGYREKFGDHHTFKQGYRKGYAVGYNDAYAGRNFRAMQLVYLAQSENLPESDAVPDRQFDQAFMLGYENGQTAGLNDGRSAAPVAALDSVGCSTIAASPKADGSYACGAYRGGYRVGYLDGYSNQRDTSEVFAQK